MRVTLVLTNSIYDELVRTAKVELETAGVLLVKPIEGGDGDFRLLAREIVWVPEEAYKVREHDGLTITSDGYVPALQLADQTDTMPIWLHTHPGDGSKPEPSHHDDIVDELLSPLFRLRSGSQRYGTLIISMDADTLTFTGRIEDDEIRHDIERAWIVGPRLRLFHNWLHHQAKPAEQFDRNVRAFGGSVQRSLGDLDIAVVGCGGTGSAVTEQLVRLGVRRLLLIDPDQLSDSNVTRVYGSFPKAVGDNKTEVLERHVMDIAPDAHVTAITSTITKEDTARALLEADVIFGCTDDNSGRLVLSRLSSYFLTPVIDCGVLISSDEAGTIDGIHGRVTVLTPGAACLVCRNRIDLQRAAAETMTPDEYGRLAGEGYAPALAGVEPAVVAFTTQVAAAAVGELIERLVHYGPEPPPSELILRIHDRELSTNDQDPRDRHYCHPSAGKLGIGMTDPFLEQTWLA